MLARNKLLLKKTPADQLSRVVRKRTFELVRLAKIDKPVHTQSRKIRARLFKANDVVS